MESSLNLKAAVNVTIGISPGVTQKNSYIFCLCNVVDQDNSDR